eukprot:9283-Eustigmatos_ZCMA.PRE.1
MEGFIPAHAAMISVVRNNGNALVLGQCKGALIRTLKAQRIGQVGASTATFCQYTALTFLSGDRKRGSKTSGCEVS